MSKKIRVCSHYFPNWHIDVRNEAIHGNKWTEWRVVQYATPRFEGHEQPKVPLWGYEDESDCAVMAKKINAATAHGIDTFIFDWYYFQSGHYRNNCIEKGFLGATNCNDIDFAIMWANHDPIYAHPGTYKCPADASLWTGKVDARTFIECTEYCIENFFNKKNYLRIDDKIYFSIYRVQAIAEELGGYKVARELFDAFRNKVQKAGLGELVIDGTISGMKQDDIELSNTIIKETGIDMVSNYSWIGHGEKYFPNLDYEKWAEMNLPETERLTKELCVSYSPLVCMGWDSSPRTVQSDMYDKCDYPFGTVITGNTPDAYGKALIKTVDFLKSGKSTAVFLNVGCWNEWTEGAYLEPDETYGFGYLEAIKNAVGDGIFVE